MSSISNSQIALVIMGLLQDLFEIMKEQRNNLEQKENVHTGDGFGSLSNDTDIKMDMVLGQCAIKELEKLNLFKRITVEGFKDIIISGSSSNLWICIDPLDGSLNYKSSIGNIGLPYAAAVTVLDRVEKAKFNNIVAAGILDFVGDNFVIAHREGDKIITKLNGKVFKLSKESRSTSEIDIANNIIIGENYYYNNRNILSKVFNGKNGWLRNPGSAAYEMMLTAIGISKAFICNTQKQHELGAGYLLIKGTGGAAIDFNMKDLSEREYDFNSKISCIFAVNEDLADRIWAAIWNALNK